MRLAIKVDIPKIPREYINNAKISQTIHAIINEFNFEEKTVIYLHCVADLSIKEIAKLTELSIRYVTSTLILYSERLMFLLSVFKEAVYFDPSDIISMREVFELEDEFDEHYSEWKKKNVSGGESVV